MDLHSVGPYLSAVNAFHTDHNVQPTAMGPVMERVRNALLRMQVPLHPMQDDRRGVPAEVMQELLTHAHDISLPRVLRLQRSPDRGAKLQPALQALQDCAATVVAYQFCNRPGTAATLQVGDLTVDPPTQLGAAITMKAKRHKGRSLDRQRDLPIVTVPSAGRPELAHVLREYIAARCGLFAAKGQPAPGHLWCLPGEGVPKTAQQTEWLQRAVALRRRAPPAGFKWTGHSMCKGAASAASAIGVSLPRVRYLGGWSPTSARSM